MEDDAAEWRRWLAQLMELRVPRWYGISSHSVEIHVFGDASELAYAAVAYIAGLDKNGCRRVVMVAAKARVAPVKVVSIPRLELQAAVLACRLAVFLEKELSFDITVKYLRTDSRTVLHWIRSDPRDYQKFVSYRLAEIENNSSVSDWRWVPSAANPADEATKLSKRSESIWFSAPSFLWGSQKEWPIDEQRDMAETEDLELVQRVHVTVDELAELLLDINKYSTWNRAQRVLARVIAFTKRCRKQQEDTLTVENIRAAEECLLRHTQAQSFPGDLQALRSGLPLPSTSKLVRLEPMLFEDGMLRVRGRLSAATNLSFTTRHPIILDGRHPITRMLVLHYHVLAMHANHETVINNMREKYWVTHLRPSVKAVVSHCQQCRVLRATPTTPNMSDLPSARLADTKRAFVYCGLDYFGPMEVKIGRRREKRWGVLFTCLASRAIHLELAASLSADSAILALRRFIARRGQPCTLYTDRGTNFIVANNELRVALRELDTTKMQDEAMTRGIEWRFNSAMTPHMGGCCERLVRSTKNSLKATLKERAPSEEVLYTLLVEAEMMINSRPLTYVTTDPDNPVVLTPNHLLLGTASGTSPIGRFEAKDLDARAHWKRAQALADIFWQRWLKEYLPTLQCRSKWTKESPAVKIGDMVLIVDKNMPRNVWPKGVISAVHPGKDGRIRVVTVRTANGSLVRPVVRLAVLPTDGNVIG